MKGLHITALLLLFCLLTGCGTVGSADTSVSDPASASALQEGVYVSEKDVGGAVALDPGNAFRYRKQQRYELLKGERLFFTVVYEATGQYEQSDGKTVLHVTDAFFRVEGLQELPHTEGEADVSAMLAGERMDPITFLGYASPVATAGSRITVRFDTARKQYTLERMLWEPQDGEGYRKTLPENNNFGSKRP